MAAKTTDEKKSPVLSRDTTVLSGVGPSLSGRLLEKGIRNVLDLVLFVPRCYEDRRHTVAISKLQQGMRVAVSGRVRLATVVGGGRGRRYEVAIDDGTGVLRLVYFNYNPYRMRLNYQKDEELWAFGQVSIFRGARQMAHPEVSRLGGSDREQGFVGVYSELAKINTRTVRKMALKAVDYCRDHLTDSVPADILAANNLPSLAQALEHLHRPTDDDDLVELNEHRSRYHQRLAFDEFFHLQVSLAQQRYLQGSRPAFAITPEQPLSQLAKLTLPFEPTGAQSRVLDEIGADMEQNQPMARLLQGDVGCGKTAVAAVAALAVVQQGLQVALLAPTEILAEQHLHTLRQLFGDTAGALGSASGGVTVELLSGSTRAKPRRELLSRLAQNQLSILVGTHALLQPEVQFCQLGLVIVDEQHRFGVKQRALLSQRGAFAQDSEQRAVPHQLVMTATPIPRSLSMTLYGDLALSVIDEMPKGRLPVRTKMIWSRDKATFQNAVQKVLGNQGQVFIVYPLVEESEKLDLADATAGAEKMRALFPQAKVGLVTGRLSGAEKEEVMSNFASGGTQILVATTVIEVGIDVPSAALMVVVNAERFGLSQLHQLRGRVGRGTAQAYCLLVHGGQGGKESWRRMKVMEESNDGFKIAEEDLAIRGPGDLLGTRQAGVPTFAFADLVKHGKLLQQARQAAFALIKRDPQLILEENQEVKRALSERYRSRLSLLQSG